MQHDDYLAVSILQTERQTHRGETAYDMKSSSLMRRSTWAPGLCSRCSLLAVTRTLFQYILHTNHQPSQGTAAVTYGQTDRQTDRKRNHGAVSCTLFQYVLHTNHQPSQTTAAVRQSTEGITYIKKVTGSPDSINERRVPELISSQPADDVSHKPGGRMPLLSARPAVTSATLKRADTNFAAW